MICDILNHLTSLLLCTLNISLFTIWLGKTELLAFLRAWWLKVEKAKSLKAFVSFGPLFFHTVKLSWYVLKWFWSSFPRLFNVSWSFSLNVCFLCPHFKFCPLAFLEEHIFWVDLTLNCDLIRCNKRPPRSDQQMFCPHLKLAKKTFRHFVTISLSQKCNFKFMVLSLFLIPIPINNTCDKTWHFNNNKAIPKEIFSENLGYCR